MKLEKHNRNKTLVIRRRFTLDFSFCDCKDYPSQKREFESLIDALKSFSRENPLAGKNPHKLDKKGNVRNSGYIQQLINNHNAVWSIDACPRNGQSGDKRVLFTYDDKRQGVVYILNCFIDTH